MSNKTFASVRLFNHLLVILQLLACISLIAIRVAFADYFSVEEVLGIGGLPMRAVLIITAFLNLIIPFFGACVIDSKLRLYMRIFLVYDSLTILINGLSLLYVYGMFMNIFEREFSKLITQNQGNRMYIENTYSCSDTSEVTCIQMFTDHLKNVQKYYIAVVGVIFGLNLVMWVLVRIALSLDLKGKRVRVPKIKKQKVGFSTGSLRNKRLVPVGNSPPESIAEQP
ncbi:putative transporter [Trachipleistophora hominis]|uniref:Putative transporter n=1 Tax=Trachipleistophora hominis TaxID=72359 RepID=L7JVS5_TRAHO|nr:putative transporter [Trachipleistophora hominis]